MIEGLYERIHKTVTKEAQKAERRWNNFVDADDIEQELWMFIMTRPSIQEYLIGADIPLAASAIGRKADSIASEERLAHDRFTGNWTYNPSEVRRLIWDVLKSPEDVPTEDRLDLEEALKYMEEAYPVRHSILHRRFWNGESTDNETFRRKVDKAIEVLTDVMNSKKSTLTHERHEGLGTASIVTDKDYY